jgi:hypothetical protein
MLVLVFVRKHQGWGWVCWLPWIGWLWKGLGVAWPSIGLPLLSRSLSPMCDAHDSLGVSSQMIMSPKGSCSVK